MGFCSFGTVTRTSPWLARLVLRPLLSLGALEEVDDRRRRPALRGEEAFGDTRVWHCFPSLTFRIFFVLVGPLRLLDLDEVDVRPSSGGLERRRCSRSSLALFDSLSERESLRARFFSLSAPCCARSARTFFSKRPSDVQDAQSCVGMGMALRWSNHSSRASGDTKSRSWWFEERIWSDGEGFWHSLQCVCFTLACLTSEEAVLRRKRPMSLIWMRRSPICRPGCLGSGSPLSLISPLPREVKLSHGQMPQ